jgi:hypothetical protein
MDKMAVTVEFYGIPRQRAGRAELVVRAQTVGDVLVAVEQACPDLAGLTHDGHLAAHYLLSIDGRQFVKDGMQRLRGGERILLLSADAGG